VIYFALMAADLTKEEYKKSKS